MFFSQLKRMGLPIPILKTAVGSGERREIPNFVRLSAVVRPFEREFKARVFQR